VNDLTPLERKFCAVFWDGPADGIMAYLFRPYPVYTWPVPLWDQANYMLESIAPMGHLIYRYIPPTDTEPLAGIG
jgi:hypothetical protein